MDKKNLSEEDIKRLYITPHIENKWHREHIRIVAKIEELLPLCDRLVK